MRRPHPASARSDRVPARRRVAPVDGAVLPAPPARPRPRLPWGRYLVLGLSAYALWIGHLEWRSWSALRRQEAALERRAASLQRQDVALRQEIAYESSPAYVEGQARQEFGLVSPGQVPLAPEGATASGQAPGAG